jgi:ribose transport system permease protein
VISACVIGGASLAGGEGSVLGSLLGVILMALILNGLNLLGINPYWQTIVIGGVLILTVAVDALNRRRSNTK